MSWTAAAGKIVGEYKGDIVWKRISAGRYHGNGPKGAVWVERIDGIWNVTWPCGITGHWGELPHKDKFIKLADAKDYAIQFLLYYVPRR